MTVSRANRPPNFCNPQTDDLIWRLIWVPLETANRQRKHGRASSLCSSGGCRLAAAVAGRWIVEVELAEQLLGASNANWEAFEAFLPSRDWTGSVFDSVERSRNVIMHSGNLGPRDIERVGIHIRDWITQVGA
jgi:hypothetical protein